MHYLLLHCPQGAQTGEWGSTATRNTADTQCTCCTSVVVSVAIESLYITVYAVNCLHWHATSPGAQKQLHAAVLLSHQQNYITRAALLCACRGGGKDRSRQLPALVRYGRDLTEEARRQLLDPVIGRQDVIQRTMQVSTCGSTAILIAAADAAIESIISST